MRKYLGNCPAVRCFSFHIYDHDRPNRRRIMREVIAALEAGHIKPAISARFPARPRAGGPHHAGKRRGAGQDRDDALSLSRRGRNPLFNPP